eukprot:scaffold25841_cov67-Cyclotella_meneghiniana.AAC.4
MKLEVVMDDDEKAESVTRLARSGSGNRRRRGLCDFDGAKAKAVAVEAMRAIEQNFILADILLLSFDSMRNLREDNGVQDFVAVSFGCRRSSITINCMVSNESGLRSVEDLQELQLVKRYLLQDKRKKGDNQNKTQNT